MFIIRWRQSWSPEPSSGHSPLTNLDALMPKRPTNSEPFEPDWLTLPISFELGYRASRDTVYPPLAVSGRLFDSLRRLRSPDSIPPCQCGFPDPVGGLFGLSTHCSDANKPRLVSAGRGPTVGLTVLDDHERLIWLRKSKPR